MLGTPFSSELGVGLVTFDIGDRPGNGDMASHPRSFAQAASTPLRCGNFVLLCAGLMEILVADSFGFVSRLKAANIFIGQYFPEYQYDGCIV
ncbi:hypothetical protein KOR42_44440 [Thalassoglobus neptunius]|uniref:Uncharacterized protein n=1 Tax=Thalassoglobus neptunius TaxID=1938619 RepID=A0A5C5VYT3_9PLAN|nr:hypothetical protein KOR42_44440 [Thalassoglobus neptunius]